jgi:hypothetical protein
MSKIIKLNKKEIKDENRHRYETNYLKGIKKEKGMCGLPPCGLESILFEDYILVNISDVFCSANIDLKDIEW